VEIDAKISPGEGLEYEDIIDNYVKGCASWNIPAIDFID
jgi:hypothetical protein